MTVKRILQVLLVLAIMLSSFAFTTQAQAWSSCGSTYVVQRGDWLAKIARKCGVSLSDLYAANQWAGYYYYIYPGQILNIPGGGSSGPVYGYCGGGSDYYGSYYIVCRGDTLFRIAQMYGVTVDHIQWRNSIPNRNWIYAGQLLRPY